MSVVFPAPFRPMSAARESCVIFTFAADKICFVVPGYVNDTSFMYITHLERDFTPSRDPGSGNRIGLMCAGWSSPMEEMAYLGASRFSPSPPVKDAEDPPAAARFPPTDATLLMALSGEGSAATISGLRDWKSRKPMG